jgi:probable HAF family extracellular repeat protein
MGKRTRSVVARHLGRTLIAAAALSCGSDDVTTPTGPGYRVTDLGIFPNGNFSSARDINSAGQVVGTGGRPDVWPGDQHPFLWEGGSLIDISRPWDPNDPDTGEAAAINRGGQVVGWIRRMNGRPVGPWRWEQDVGLTGIGRGEGDATDINDAGQAVGCLRALTLEAGFNCHAAIMENDQYTDLGALSVEGESQAYGIDPTGRVVGKSDGRAFLWDQGVMTDLNIPGGESLARRINAAGQVAGQVTANQVTRGFLWENGTITDLGEVVQVSDINAGGQIVGWRNVNGIDQAFVWHNGAMTDFPGPSRAYGINDEGQIVGDAGGNPYSVGARATLWTPK